MTGIEPVQRLTASRHTVTTRQLVGEDSMPINKGAGGLEDTRGGLQNRLLQDTDKETGYKGLLRLHHSSSGENTLHS